MVAIMILAAVAVSQQNAQTHVRTSEPRIAALIQAGRARSATLLRLVETLDHSDVIVYVEPKLGRESLGGFLQNDVVVTGGYRYLRIAIDFSATEESVLPVLAHELQHASEVAQEPTALNAASIEKLFARLTMAFGCNGPRCFETQAALAVEEKVRAELKATR